jgi:hypothetical protein
VAIDDEISALIAALRVSCCSWAFSTAIAAASAAALASGDSSVMLYQFFDNQHNPLAPMNTAKQELLTK